MKKFWHFAFLVASVILGLYIRIVNPWKDVFTWTVRLGGNDPWYYFRLIQNCLHNFPYRIWFDPFTHYPYGTYTHFGPFLVYFSAILCKIFGATTSESIRSVLAFIPTIGGALLALPTYLFTKEAFGKKAGVISALLVVIIPGQLLARSILGFNDHHVWEVFWMTAALSLYAHTINEWRNDPNAIRNNRKLALAILTGIAYGMYLLTWAPSFYLALFIVGYVFILMIFEKFINSDVRSVIYVSVISLAVATVMFLPFAFNTPFLSTTHYSPFQLLVLCSCIAMLLTFRGIGILKERGYYARLGIREEYAFPATMAAIISAVVLVMFVASPGFFHMLLGVIGVIQPKGGALTIAEVQPFFTMGGQFSLAPAYLNFGTAFFFGFFGFLVLSKLVYEERRDVHVLILLWSLMLFVALCGQNRFAYYFGVVCAVMSGFLLDRLLDRLNFYGILERRKVSYTKLSVAVLLIILLFVPTFALAYDQSKYAGGIPKPWWDALVWMRNNTPGKENYDRYYYELYKPPEDWRKPYPYPFKTYGVMSWWDYGHWIEAIAHRMPIANPFQQGIGNKYDNVPGAAPFFTSFNESYADEIAKKLNVKYVISDVEMETGKFYAMAVWAEGSLEKASRIYYRGSAIAYITPQGQIGITTNPFVIPPGSVRMSVPIPSEKYFETMEARLHLMDGCGLSHYRMIYESEIVNSPMEIQEMIYKLIFDKYYAKKLGLPQVNVTPSGYVKIFEFVKGVEVTGKADAKNVTVSVVIKTNQNRTFVWQKTVPVVNGTYEVVVPYAQNTEYPVKPVGDYTIRAGNVVRHFSVTDEQVENGAVVRINLT